MSLSEDKSIHLPPILENNQGDLRKVGMELEFTGMDLEEAVGIVQACYGGTIRKEHRYHFDIADTRYGDFRVELDALILKKMAGSDLFEKSGLDVNEQKLMESVEDILDKAAKTIVPLEIVMPPIAMEDIGAMEQLRKQLQIHKAEGTKTSWMHAFGMHINIELPDLKPDTLLRYLRSFLLLYPWLLERLDVDVFRRISPFVDPFPDSYTEMILDTDYGPGMEQLTEDYLEFNSTRNRPLDLIPVFALLDKKKILSVMKGSKNLPRPALHYRLPNSRIDDPEWKFLDEWKSWLEVERLAADPEMIRKLSRLYLLRKEKTLVSFRKEWVGTVNILLDLDE